MSQPPPEAEPEDQHRDASAPPVFDASADRFTYEMLTYRFLAHDEMLWQTPALALAAQAFLMTIALGPEAGFAERAIASFLGFVLMLMSMHLLGRHRFLGLIEKAKLSELERDRLRIEPLASAAWAWEYAEPPAPGKAYKKSQYSRKQPRYPWIFSIPSYLIWVAGLGLFAVADGLIFVSAVFRWDWLGA